MLLMDAAAANDDDDDDVGLSEGVRTLGARSHHRCHHHRFSADNCTGLHRYFSVF